MNVLFITWVAIRLFAGPAPVNHELTECLIKFRIKNAGTEVRGSIEEVNAEINFNESNLENSTIVASAKTTSIRTGISIRDKHLQRSDYFNSELYPEITMTSKSFKKVGRNSFIGIFILTIKNHKKEITMRFTVEQLGEHLVYEGNFEMNRLEFGIGEGSLILENTVKVFVSAQIKRGN